MELDSGTAGAQAEFEDGTKLGAPLIIGADGRNSAVREAVGIRTFSWTYDQTALAGSFSHERPHNDVCIEFHRQAGPFTLIPLPGNRCSFVWSERKADAERLLALDNAGFAAEAEKASRFALGRIFDPSELAAFPLSSVLVREYGRARVALAGEAAHAAPPIGAQGLNLGFRDVEALAALIGEARRRGEDIGSDKLLRAYSAARRGDILSRTLGLDLLNRSLLTGFLPLQAARGLGLYALGTVGPLRRAFMRRGIAPAGLFDTQSARLLGEVPPHSVSLPASPPWRAGISAWPHPQADAAGREDPRTPCDENSGVPSPRPHPLAGAAAKDASTPRRACAEKDRMRGDFAGQSAGLLIMP